MIEWNELFKIRLSKAIERMDKHEVVKLLLVRMLIRKYRKDKNFIRIFTEFPTTENLSCDVYYENARKKEICIYDIKENYLREWVIKREIAYNYFDVPFIKDINWILIDLKDFSENIEEIKEDLKKYV